MGLLWRRRAARAGNPYAQRLLEAVAGASGGGSSSSTAAQAVRGADVRVEDAGDVSAAAGLAEGPALTISADVVASFWQELLPVRQAFPSFAVHVD